MAIAFVGGATNGSASAVTTITVNYTPTAGNVVIVVVSTANFPGTVTVSDSSSNPLAAGPAVQNTHSVGIFYYVAGSGITSFTASYTISRTPNISVIEYSGVARINASLAGNSATGTSTAPSITVTTEDANNWVVAGFMTTGQVMTTTVGTQREQVGIATAPRQTVVDNTVAVAGSVSCSGTITSAAWGVVLIELRTAAAAAGPSNWLGVQVATGINKH